VYLSSGVDGCWIWSPGFSRLELAYCWVARNFFTRSEPRTLCRLKAGLQTFHRSLAPLNIRASSPRALRNGETPSELAAETAALRR